MWFTRRAPLPPARTAAPEAGAHLRAPDPIGDICRSLAERPWEWDIDTKSDYSYSNNIICVRHSKSGVWVVVNTNLANYGETKCHVGQTGRGGVRQSKVDSVRLSNGVNARAAALVTSSTYRFTDSARLLAHAVLAGELDAAFALADEIIDTASRPAKDRADG